MGLTKIILAIGCAATTVIAFSGDMTFYSPGQGACGDTNTDADHIVALSPGDYGSCGNPNDCPNCDRNINIHYNGKTTSAKVKDKCPGCSGNSIDVSPAVFNELADPSKGRVQVTWEFA